MMPGPLEHRGGKTRSARERKVKGLPGAVLVCALVFLLVLTSGCGEDSKQARTYMNKGDALYQEAMEEASAWQVKVKSLSSLTSPADFEETVQKSKALAGEVLKISGEGAAQFQKIYDLDGVKDYKEYADIRISEFDILEDIVKTMNDTLDKAAALIDSGRMTELAALYQEATDELEALTKKGQGLEDQASKLRLKKEL
jgi:hypothetical protein